MPILMQHCHPSSIFVFLLFLTGVVNSHAATLATLPSPLHLHQALQIAAQDHPVSAIANARVMQAQAQVLEAEANSGFDSFLELKTKRVKQATTELYFNNSSVHLGARHVLFDFGVSSAIQARYQHNVAAQKQLEIFTLTQQRIITERAFYDVLLSDLRFNADNEIMTVAFLVYDKVRERHSLGIFSDLELAEAEHKYRVLLNTRKSAEIQQRVTRQNLAILLNRPNDVPVDLIMPELNFLNKKPPDANEYYQRCRKVNPLILSLRADANAKRSAVLAEKNGVFPVITAELDLTEYDKEPTISNSSRNNMEIALRLKLPLYQSGLRKAKTSQAIADLQTSMAQLRIAELQLQQKILELVSHLDTLLVHKTTAEQELDFRDLDLDKRRAEYEMELQTDMGSVTARLTLAHWQAAKIDFDIELSWKKLNALLGPASSTIPEDISP